MAPASFDSTDASLDTVAFDSLGLKVPSLIDVLELLSQHAHDVDRSTTLPPENLRALATAGLYGAGAANEEGGLDLDLAEMSALVELLASACLTTTFVWLQHFRLLHSAASPLAPDFLRTRLPAIVRGDIKGGVSFTALLPGPPRLTAHETASGWVLDGDSPWVSGWGIVDELVVMARVADEVASFVLEARDHRGMDVTPLRLSAMNASATVTLTFDGTIVPRERYVGSAPYDAGPERPEGLRVNGSLALGVARRCADLVGPSILDEELRHARETLDRADVEHIGDARARAAQLAVRAAHALAVSRGSRSALYGDVAERSTREASLLLVFGSRPMIKRALLDRLLGPS
ncbi:MAG: acyl-CoA dehydrogenase family protein [Acidimicrobiales bacterium]